MVLLLAGLLAAGWTAATYREVEAEREGLESRLASIRQATEAMASKRPDTGQETRKAAGNTARQRLDLPWAHLTAALHEARSKDIGFLSIKADGRQGQLTLIAEARNYGAMLEFYQRLQSAQGVSAVTLAQHELREVEGARPVGFTMRLRWGQP
jgi:nitrate reductase NapAB chaperone NapD